MGLFLVNEKHLPIKVAKVRLPQELTSSWMPEASGTRACLLGHFTLQPHQ